MHEMGIEDKTGALQGAFSPCWRWFGVTRAPAHEWTHVATAYAALLVAKGFLLGLSWFAMSMLPANREPRQA